MSFYKLFKPKNCALLAVSCGIGVCLGRKIERQNNHVNHRLLPIVNAATSLTPTKNQPSSLTPVLPPVTQGNRVSEIMRFGFPGMENLRTYEDYVLSYDKRNKTANWVFEHLTKEKLTYNNSVDRSKCEFKEDLSVHHYHRSTNEDYKGSGFDRGHLAAAGNHRMAQNHVNQTFFLCNISPQVGKGFNRGCWNQLEKHVRHLTKAFKNVYVCTGPLYLPRNEPDGKTYIKYQVIGKNNVAVPTHFFKVVLCETDSGEYDLLSYVMPNTDLPETVNLNLYLVPVDAIERASGLLFFDKFPKNRFRMINGNKL